jgi:hypothetical protein
MHLVSGWGTGRNEYVREDDSDGKKVSMDGSNGRYSALIEFLMRL